MVEKRMADTLLEIDGIETCYGLSQVLFGLSLSVRTGEQARHPREVEAQRRERLEIEVHRHQACYQQGHGGEAEDPRERRRAFRLAHAPRVALHVARIHLPLIAGGLGA